MGNFLVLIHDFKTSGLATDCGTRTIEVGKCWHQCPDRVAAETSWKKTY